MKLKSQAQFVDRQGKLTPEAFLALQPSGDDIVTVTTTQYQAITQCQVFLPAAALVNIARGASAINVTTLHFILNPGDVLTLGGATLLTIMPL